MIVKNICVLAMLLLSLSGYEYAQTRPSSEAEVEGLLKKATEARKLLQYRRTRSDTFFSGGRGIRSKYVTEYSPDRSRTVNERRTLAGKYSKTETIWINKVKYVRVGDGTWTVTNQEPSSEGSEYASGRVIETGSKTGEGNGNKSGTVFTGSFREEPQIEEKFAHIGDTELDGKPSDLYRKIRKSTSGPAGEKLTIVTTTKYWFDKQGRLLKQTEEARFSSSFTLYEIIIEYEYDLVIKIEAPIENK